MRSIVRFARTEPVGAARPAELHPTLTDHAKFVICDHTIEQDHRGVKRVTRPMLGFKSFVAAQDTLVGIELMHMMDKAPCGRTLQHLPSSQGLARCAGDAYVP